MYISFKDVIVFKALHTINACFSGERASRTCRFNHSCCIWKNRHFQKQNVAGHRFGTTLNILKRISDDSVTATKRMLCTS